MIYRCKCPPITVIPDCFDISDEKELERLRELQRSRTRWFSQDEFDRLKLLEKKKWDSTP